MQLNQWKSQTILELKRAIDARNAGNEGMARVCARRAAGMIVEEYLKRTNNPIHTSSALTLLKSSALEQLSPEIRERIEHFLIHVTPDHRLPIDVDLIAEARQLAVDLLGEDLPDFPPSDYLIRT